MTERLLGVGHECVELEISDHRMPLFMDRLTLPLVRFYVQDKDFDTFKAAITEMRFLAVLQYCRDNGLPEPVRAKDGSAVSAKAKRGPFGKEPLQPGLCSYCNQWSEKLTRDHIVPVSEGGTDDPDNIVPACQSCNSKKHAKSLLQFAQEIGREANLMSGVEAAS